MRLLVLEPYYAGSHRAFLDGWRAHSCHEWTLLTLPGHKWKWRMRHASFTFAEEIQKRFQRGERWDLVFATDMINLAELLGLAGEALNSLPTIAYFHENQLTYPAIYHEKRDYHFAITNFATASAADQVWFNSEYHRREFLSELPRFLRRMPDYQLLEWFEKLENKSVVYPQGINPLPHRPPRVPGPLRILWAARWEYDKNPDDFFAAMRQLRERGIVFRLNVIGEQFESIPPIFASAREEFADKIDCWGYQESRADYEQCLLSSDVIVSTAIHEFFGVTVVEAASAGVAPLLPNRLAYPEIFPPDAFPEFFYDGTIPALVKRLEALAERVTRSQTLPAPRSEDMNRAISRFYWTNLAPVLDKALSAFGNDDCH